jgi:hypothetical protein
LPGVLFQNQTPGTVFQNQTQTKRRALYSINSIEPMGRGRARARARAADGDGTPIKFRQLDQGRAWAAYEDGASIELSELALFEAFPRASPSQNGTCGLAECQLNSEHFTPQEPCDRSSLGVLCAKQVPAVLLQNQTQAKQPKLNRCGRVCGNLSVRSLFKLRCQISASANLHTQSGLPLDFGTD